MKIEDVKAWCLENRAELDESRLACEDAALQIINKMNPSLLKRLWDSGCWLAMKLREHGATEEQVQEIQFAHGQRAFGGCPYQVALGYAKEFAENGDTKEKGGEALADKIHGEVFGD